MSVTWMNIVDQAIYKAKARILAVLNSLNDPKANADLAIAEYKEIIQMLNRAGVLMRTKRVQLVYTKNKIDMKAKEAHAKAEDYVKKGQRDYAYAFVRLQARAEKQSEVVTNTIKKIDTRLVAIEGKMVESQATQEFIEMSVEVEKMRLDVADAEIAVDESESGIRRKGTNIYNALTALGNLADEREARAQALSEMKSSGLLPDINQKLAPVDPGRIDDIMRDIENEIRRTDVNREIEIPDSKESA